LFSYLNVYLCKLPIGHVSAFTNKLNRTKRAVKYPNTIVKSRIAAGNHWIVPTLSNGSQSPKAKHLIETKITNQIAPLKR